MRESVRRMTGYTPGEQPADPGLVKLNTNENPYPPSPRVLEAMRGIQAGSLRRYPDPVCRRLRGRIAELHGVDASRVFVGNGSDEILALCTRAFVEDGRGVGYFDPSYSLYPVLADIRGALRVPVDLGRDLGWPADLVKGGEAPALGVCSLFLLANPNAPTGLLSPKEKVRELCAAFDGVVAIDEAYVDFAPVDCMDVAREVDNALAIRTLSKSYSLAGLRLGYAVGPADLVEALFKIKDSYNVDAISQELALAALSDVDYMRANAGKIKRTRQRLAECLAERGFRVYPSAANFLWVQPPGRSARELFDQLRERRVLVRFFPGERTGEFLRITIGTDADVDGLLAALDEVRGSGTG